MKRLIALVTAGLCAAGVGVAGTGTAAAAGAWSVVTLPLPADAGSSPGVTIGTGACAAPGRCVIPGGYITANHRNLGLIETVSNGVATAVSLPAPPDAAKNSDLTFTKAACTSSGECVAIGSYRLQNGTPSAGALAFQTGSEWHVIIAPAPSPYHAKIRDVACSGSVCFAVGNVLFGGYAPLVERFQDGSWTYTTLSAVGDLQTIACSSATRCVTAGDHYESGRYQAPLGATWDGSSWTTSALPAPADVSLSSKRNVPQVSDCSSDGACHVLGPYHPKQAESARFRPVDYANDGTSWTATALPDGTPPATLEVDMSALQCSAVDACTAVGLELGEHSSYRGVVAHLSAEGWAVTYAPLPASKPSGGLTLTALSCPAGACTAFGAYHAPNFTSTAPIATSLTGTPRTTILPLPAGFTAIYGVPTALYDGTRQLVAAAYSGTGGHQAALWMRTI